MGGIASGYHTVDVLLHLANTLLLWHLLRRLTVPAAWVAAAVFAVHPVHVESVAWIIERKDVLSGLFYLLAASAWVRFAEQPARLLRDTEDDQNRCTGMARWTPLSGQPRPRWYLSALAAYLAGLLSKSVVVTLPVALLIGRWWKNGRVFAVGGAITVADLLFNRSRGVGGFGCSLIERGMIAARAFSGRSSGRVRQRYHRCNNKPTRPVGRQFARCNRASRRSGLAITDAILEGERNRPRSMRPPDGRA